MSASLLETARANRIEALAYLDRLCVPAAKKEQILDLSFLRKNRKPTVMFTSCRAGNHPEKQAA